MKHLHMLFVALVAFSFIGRVYLAQYKPALLANKWIKITPHVVATLLLLTGVGLVFQGNWLAGDYAWIVVKLILMIVFIGLGILAMKTEGEKRWYFFGGALFCLVYIIKIAFTKQVFFFL
jgi:uncharacterized membrane protein SirB2